jgi:flagellar basal body-associated protein FliL
MILGIPDPSIWIAYLLLIILTLLCVVYGIVMWNKEGDISVEEAQEEKQWSREEIELEEEVSGGGQS